MSAPLLRIEALSVSAMRRSGAVTLVDGLNLTIADGERVGIVGESGSGKSLSCLSIMGLLPAGLEVSAGRIDFRGQNLVGLSTRQYNKVRGDDIAMIYQEPLTSLNPLMRVGRQVGETLPRETRVHQRVLAALDRVGIADPERVAKQYPHELSGGMRQRVMIAMASVKNPALLIADEPTTALDVTIQTQVLKVMYEVSEELGTAILLVSHDLAAVERLVDRIVVMYAGRIVEDGPTQEVLTDPRHPYTRALLASAPKMSTDDASLPVIGGSVPAPGSWPPGCRFAPRCPLRQQICGEHTPGMEHVGQSHTAACWVTAADFTGGKS